MAEAYQLPGLPCPLCKENGLRLVVDGSGSRKVCYLACTECRELEDPVSMNELASVVSGLAERAEEEGSVDKDWIQEHIKEVLGYEN